MKENKFGTIICGTITIVCLVASIIFDKLNCVWWMNLSFALMGSAFLSCVICTINYVVFRKRIIEDLVNGFYRYHHDAMTQLYSLEENIKIEKISLVVGAACSYLNILIFLAYNIKTGLFLIERKKREILSNIIVNLESKIQLEFNEIGTYLHKRPRKAEGARIYLKKQVEKLLNNSKAYNLSLKLVKMVNLQVKTAEETFGKTEKQIESMMCYSVEQRIKLMKLKEQRKIRNRMEKSKEKQQK